MVIVGLLVVSEHFIAAFTNKILVTPEPLEHRRELFGAYSRQRLQLSQNLWDL